MTNSRLDHALKYSKQRVKERAVVSNIYLIRCGEFYKIGIADDPRARLGQLQIGNPDTLELVRYWPSYDAEAEEKYIHNLLGCYHHKGEWFKLPKLLINFICFKP